MSALMRRVGHKGADLIVPGNTFASFRAALEAGVDMIEFDVLSERTDGTGDLFLAHDYVDARSRIPHSLEDGLEHFAGEAYAGVELDVDLKIPGYELRVLEALERFGLLDRVLVTSMELESLRIIRAARADVRLGLSVPKLRRDPMLRPHTAAVALVWGAWYRSVLPGRVARLIRDGVVDAVMSHWRLVTPRLVRAVDRSGGELYVWTVDDPKRIAVLERLGVTGVITNDPRLFAPATP